MRQRNEAMVIFTNKTGFTSLDNFDSATSKIPTVSIQMGPIFASAKKDSIKR